MTHPQRVSELQSLLGMTQYSAQFVENFSELTAPLPDLTCQDSTWRWTEVEETDSRKLKGALTSPSVLGYYQTGIPIKLTVDVGPHGTGFIVFQEHSTGL